MRRHRLAASLAVAIVASLVAASIAGATGQGGLYEAFVQLFRAPFGVTNPSTDQVLKFDGTKWVNGSVPPSATGGGWTDDGATVRLTTATDQVAIATASPATGAELTVAGEVAGGNGAAGTPTYAFSSDLDTGVYRSGADAIGLSTAGTSRAVVDATGLVLQSGATSGATLAAAHSLAWSTRSQVSSPADGNLLLRDSAGTAFSLLQLGGTTASYPALKRSGAGVDLRLADDSGYAAVGAGQGTFQREDAGTSTVLTVTSARRTTSGTAAAGLGVASTWELEDSAGNFDEAARVEATWADATSTSEDADLVFKLTISGISGVEIARLRSTGLFTFGGTTASFPAIKRSSTEAQFRLADDSGFAPIRASVLSLSGTSNQLVLQSEGVTGTLTWTPSTSGKTITLPNLTGTAALLDGGQTFTSAVWQGTAVAAGFGGTGQTSYAAGDLLYATGATTLAKLAIGANATILQSTGSAPSWVALSTIDHGSLGGLTDDDHTQYALLAGRTGGQVLTGGIAASNSLVLVSTSNATKGIVEVLKDDSLTSTVGRALQVSQTSTGTAANGLGVQVVLSVEDSAGNKDDAASIDAVWTDATSGSEDSDLVVSLRAAGAAPVERIRATSVGLLTFGGTSSSFPALKPSGADLQVRLADDSAAGTLWPGTLKGDSLKVRNAAGTFVAEFGRGGNTRTEVQELAHAPAGDANGGVFLIGANTTFASSVAVSWTSGGNWFSGSMDVGLAREAAGVLRITDGSTGSGKAGFSLRTTSHSTSPVTVTVTDSARVYTNEGASGEVNFNLPAAAAGLTHTFVVQAAQTLRVTAATGDTIRIAGSVSGAAGNVSNATVGGTIYLIAINATEWIAVATQGTWTVT